MALKQAKKQVNLKASVADNIGIPKFPDTNIAAEIAKPISEAIDAFRAVAEADAATDFKVSFNDKSRDHYIQLQEKFKFDPDGMKNAVDSYSKNLIESTPTVYKNYVSNILAQKNLANLGFATKNYRARNDAIALDGFQSSRNDNEDMLSMQLSNIVDTDAPITNINSYIANTTFKNHNEIYGSAEQSLVNTMRYSGNNLRKDLETDLKNTEVLRIVSNMKKLDKANAIKYITSYAQGNDQLKLTTDDLENIQDAQNPIFKKYENYVGNEFNRKAIVKNAMDLYENYNADKIKSLMASKQTYDLEGLQEPGQPFHISQFQDSANSNATEYVLKNLEGISKTQFNKAVQITQNNILAQKIASDMIAGTQKDFINDDQKELVTSALLSRYGINNENITDVSNPNLAVAMEVLSKYNITPTAVLKKLNTKINVDYNNAGMIEEYKNNLSLYNFTKQKYPGLVVDNEFIYEEGNLMGALSIQDDATLASKLNSISADIPNAKANKIKLEEHLGINAKESVSIFKDLISELDINTDTNWVKKFFNNGKNEYADIFNASSTTFGFSFAGTLLTEPVKAKWLAHTITNLNHMNGGKEFDITSDKGKQMFKNAAMSALDAMNKEGYGATNFTGNNQIEIKKHPYEKEIGFMGQGFENSIIAIGNELESTLSETEKRERFGVKDEGFGIPLTDMVINRKSVPNSISDIIKIEIDNGFENTIIEPTGTMNKYGKPNYHLKINHNGYTINLTEGNKFFDPTGFGGMQEISGQSASRKSLINTLTEEKYNQFEKNFGHLLDGNDGWQGFAKNVIYKTIKTGIEASDYKFYPDIPGINDVPAEVKPFAFIFKTLGIDVDLAPYYEEGAKINNTINDTLSYDARIQANSKIVSKDKQIESVFPPHKMKYTEQNMGLKFRQHVYDNYENKSLPLTFRTNNYMAVMKTDSAWVGEMTDVDTGNQAAVFASPIDSIRAGMRVMINNSTLINNNTTKRYGDQPTIAEILSTYAEDTDIYLEALEQKTEFSRDTAINFFDSTQVSKLIKFMIEHEMGSEAFNSYYPPENQLYLDAMILEGYELGINSYGGKLGKVR
jgi:hypothetical protein